MLTKTLKEELENSLNEENIKLSYYIDPKKAEKLLKKSGVDIKKEKKLFKKRRELMSKMERY